jgi:transposase
MIHPADIPLGTWKGTGMRPKGTAAELEQRRRWAIALLEQGMKPIQVAKTVGVSPPSVTRWRQAVQNGGRNAMASKPHPGRRRRLTDKQRRRLPELLLQGARKHGFRTDLWTLSRVAQVIAKTFDIRYHPGHVWRLLQSLGWSSQKPESRAREREEQALQRWRQNEGPRIKKRPKIRSKHRGSG